MLHVSIDWDHLERWKGQQVLCIFSHQMLCTVKTWLHTLMDQWQRFLTSPWWREYLTREMINKTYCQSSSRKWNAGTLINYQKQSSLINQDQVKCEVKHLNYWCLDYWGATIYRKFKRPDYVRSDYRGKPYAERLRCYTHCSLLKWIGTFVCYRLFDKHKQYEESQQKIAKLEEAIEELNHTIEGHEEDLKQKEADITR